MAKDRSGWEAGRRAWKRLAAWVQDADRSEDGDDALVALGDIGSVRRLLDRAELAAVQASRRHGRSWSEIATRLGVTRQSAWQRWRDVDEAAPDAEPLSAPFGAPNRPAAMVRRRQVVVPDVVGMTYDNARDVLMTAHLVPVNAGSDDPPLPPELWHSTAVVHQYPDPGTRLQVGSQVRLRLGRGGGEAGVREPRRPVPPLREAGAEVDIESVVGE